MSRIAFSPPRGILARVVAFVTRRLLGRVPGSMRVQFHNRKTFQGLVGMEYALRSAKTLEEDLKALVYLRVAMLVGCPA